jgi:pyruvate dehydrogenase E2 component (dihydrolipoamide acetyltransferase)
LTANLSPAPLLGRVMVERDSVNDDSVIVTRLAVSDGEVVAKGQVVLDIETSKSASEVVSPQAGRIVLRVCVGDELKIGELMFEVIPAEAQVPATTSTDSAALPVSSVSTSPVDPAVKAPVFSLAARRAALLQGIAPDRFAPGAWVTAVDVAAVAKNDRPPAAQSATETPAPAAGAAASSLQKLSKRKRNEIRNLAIGNAHGSTSTIGATFTAEGQRLVKPPPIFRDTIADLVIFEGSRLFRQYPGLNAYWVDDRQIALYDSVNFGVSFDSGDNLKVLAISGADQRSLIDIQNEYTRLLDLYEAGGRIDDELLSGATVTLSDLSRVPISFMHPLVNGRQALILGITRASAVRYDVFASFDHRVSEGLAVSRFLSELRERVVSHFGAASTAVGELFCSACRRPMAEELQLGGRGFLNVTLGDGSKGLLCRNCFIGY